MPPEVMEAADVTSQEPGWSMGREAEGTTEASEVSSEEDNDLPPFFLREG